MSTATLTHKEEFKVIASNFEVSASYSGKHNTMFITGDDKKVKTFIRVRNLLGKAAHQFKIAQSK